MYQLLKRDLHTALTIGLSAAFLCGGPARAEFTLNWNSDTGNPVFSGTTISHTDVFQGGTSSFFNQTPFVYERVSDGTTDYYHLIVGDPATGFAQEVYIQTGFDGLPTDPDTQSCRGPTTCTGTAAPLISNQHSASDGESWASDRSTFLEVGNGSNPLTTDAAYSGNSSGNPSRVQMRQLVTDGDLTVDFVKDKFAEKPSITNTIDAADLNATFVINSSGNPLNSAATASVVTNTVELRGSDLPPDVAPPGGGPSSVRFDMATDAQESSVTAGQYSFTAGSGPGGSSGTYSYTDPTKNSANINPDWSSYFDHNEANPWGYTDNRPTP